MYRTAGSTEIPTLAASISVSRTAGPTVIPTLAAHFSFDEEVLDGVAGK
jgi:hypothetical protein